MELGRHTSAVDAEVGSRIKQLRNAKGLSQIDLAAVIDVSVRTIGTWEKTGKVPMERMGALSEALGADPTDLGRPPSPPVTAIEHRGWRVTIQASPDATPEQVRKAESALLDTALTTLRELGLEDT